MSRCPSRLTLHRLLHGELEGEAGLAEHVQGCERCSAWLERTRASERELEQEADPRRFAASVAARRQGGGGRRLQLLAAAAVVLLAVGVTVIIWPRPPEPPPGGTAIKGTSSLRIHCRRRGEVFELDPGDAVQGGDALRFEVFSDAHTHVLGLSMRPDGQVSVYAPFGGVASVPLTRGRAQVLPGSVVLDDGAGDELLVFVFSRGPVTADAARRRAREALGAAGGRLREVRRLDLPGEQKLRLLTRERR
jgi:hypothetical protein